MSVIASPLLLTNDDGIHAPGLAALEQALKTRGHSFLTVAPLHEKSGASHAITLDRPLRVRGFGDGRHAIDGTPADAVFLGINQVAPQRPKLVISGINRGANLGNDLVYSGTVAAAVEAWYHGVTALAVSLYITDGAAHTAAHFIRAADLLFSRVLPEIQRAVGTEALYGTPHLFNINIPDFTLSDDAVALRWTLPGQREYGGEVVRRLDPRGREYFWIGGDQHRFTDIPESDCNAVREGCISITPLSLSFSDRELFTAITRK